MSKFTAYCAEMPYVIGQPLRTYAPITLARSRGECWARTIEWADAVACNKTKWFGMYGHLMTMTPQMRLELKHWNTYNAGADRNHKIAWLKRRGCRVVAAKFANIVDLPRSA